jgi:uncharacterized protein HemY
LHPKRFNSILGAARAAQALEDEKTTKRFYAELLEIGVDKSNRGGLREAHTYMGELTNEKE